MAKAKEEPKAEKEAKPTTFEPESVVERLVANLERMHKHS